MINENSPEHIDFFDEQQKNVLHCGIVGALITSEGLRVMFTIGTDLVVV